jgi:hypothetical protein
LQLLFSSANTMSRFPPLAAHPAVVNLMSRPLEGHGRGPIGECIATQLAEQPANGGCRRFGRNTGKVS